MLVNPGENMNLTKLLIIGRKLIGYLISRKCARLLQQFVHLFNNLNYGGSKHSNLRSASKTKRKNKTRPELRKHTKDPPLAPLFSALCNFFLKFFGLHQRVPLHCFVILQHNGCQKYQRVPLLHFSAL